MNSWINRLSGNTHGVVGVKKKFLSRAVGPQKGRGRTGLAARGQKKYFYENLAGVPFHVPMYPCSISMDVLLVVATFGGHYALATILKVINY